MALADRRDARLQGVRIEPPGHTGHIEDVVVVPGRIELAQDIDSLLLERQADVAEPRPDIAQTQ